MSQSNSYNYMQIYIHTYMHTLSTCTCMRVYVHTYINTCMHACIHISMHVCMHTYILYKTCMHINVHTYIHTYIHACIHTFIHAFHVKLMKTQQQHWHVPAYSGTLQRLRWKRSPMVNELAELSYVIPCQTCNQMFPHTLWPHRDGRLVITVERYRLSRHMWFLMLLDVRWPWCQYEADYRASWRCRRKATGYSRDWIHEYCSLNHNAIWNKHWINELTNEYD